MRKSIALLLGVLVPVLGLAGVGDAQTEVEGITCSYGAATDGGCGRQTMDRMAGPYREAPPGYGQWRGPGPMGAPYQQYQQYQQYQRYQPRGQQDYRQQYNDPRWPSYTQRRPNYDYNRAPAPYQQYQQYQQYQRYQPRGQQDYRQPYNDPRWPNYTQPRPNYNYNRAPAPYQRYQPGGYSNGGWRGWDTRQCSGPRGQSCNH